MTTYLITGSNRGIGLEFCRQLRARGDYVIAACRSTSLELGSIGVRVEEEIEITSENSLLKLKNNLGKIKIDVLIQNAAIAENNSLENLNSESITRQFEVNALGPLKLTGHLLEKLRPGSKVIFNGPRAFTSN